MTAALLARRHDARPPPAPLPPPDAALSPRCDPPDARPDPDLAPSASLSKRRPPRVSAATAAHALACALCIMASLMVYSLLQERIMTRPYASRTAASTTALFPHSLFLVLANRMLAAVLALALIVARADPSHLRPAAPLAHYASVSLSNVIATSCQYEALKWLTFPTVTIGKCAKMLPVMLILKFRSARQYSYEDFAVVAVVLAGCATMISSGNVAATHPPAADADTPFGFALMLLYLLFDAVTSTHQEALFRAHNMSVYNQMLYINLSSALISVLALTARGGLRHSLSFIARFPAVLPDICTLSLSAVAGQFAITYTIHAFGALLYAAVMTTRQFCSVLASDIIFKHGLTAVQWSGATMVFAALFFKLWRKATRASE